MNNSNRRRYCRATILAHLDDGERRRYYWDAIATAASSSRSSWRWTSRSSRGTSERIQTDNTDYGRGVRFGVVFHALKPDAKYEFGEMVSS